MQDDPTYAMDQAALWDSDAAARYDSPGEGMFSEATLDPCVDRLAALADGGPVLEFAIGTGRVAVPLAERGVSVSGIELSEPMIDVLRTKADSRSIPVVHGDMSSARVTGEFSLVFLVFNTIANLLTQDEQIDCFRNAARHLRPRGRFVIELWIPQLPPTGADTVVFTSERGYFGLDRYDLLNQRLVSHHFRFDEGRQARLDRTPHRFIWPAELDLMARLAGFERESRYADWEGTPLTGESRSHVTTYRLATDAA